MFFVLSKVLGFFAIPSNLVILLGIGGALLFWSALFRHPVQSRHPARDRRGASVALALSSRRLAAHDREPARACPDGAVAAWQCADHSAGEPVSSLGCGTRGA